MRFLLMVQADERLASQESPEVFAGIMAAVEDIDAAFVKEGRKIGRVRLDPASTARTVRLDGSRKTVTDGPYVDTKEHLGGFWIVEAADADEATELAKRLPLVPYASVEVRQIMAIDLPKTLNDW